ncbi:MAG: CCA tRNA nucleotidyltransferase [Pigmentiphaga sp.]
MARDSAVAGLAVYVVGGAVRDALLGVPAGDRDWVVVGASPEGMAKRGFTPVGGDFPVFLHPRTHEEYALARTERKTARGYRGFVFHAGPDVTLEQDLQRRDLTVNAMALSSDGLLHDPWRGREDLQARCLRHVGDAFAEDPVRILRLARFAARFHDFKVATETLVLCRAMVAAGEADALVPERVWREIARGLMEARPQRLFEVLTQADALARIAPEWQAAWEEPSGGLAEVLSRLASPEFDLSARYALACLPVAEAAGLHRRLRVPVECADMARLLALWRDALSTSNEAGLPDTAEAVLDRIERCDGLRKPSRFAAVLVLAAMMWPRQVAQDRWGAALAAVREVDAGAVARRQTGGGMAIREAVRAARLAALGETGLIID